jgi:hypothetical protein
MAEMTFDQILRAARQLPPRQQDELIRQLRTSTLTRERLTRELKALQAAGVFDHAGSLKGKHASAGPAPDADEVEAYLKDLSREWENDLDGLA